MELNSDNIKDFISSDKDQYEIFNINYTSDEKNTINRFNLNEPLEYNNYGDNMLDDLEFFVNKIGDNTPDMIKKMVDIIKKITNIVTSGYEMESYWLTIRIIEPTSRFNIPRWHCDGNYFHKADERHIVSKFATTLIGKGTLLLNTTPDERKHFFKSEKIAKTLGNMMSDEYRLYMKDNIRGDIIPLTNTQSVIFLSGDKMRCGIHSEPKIDTMRMFISIAPGSIKEVDGWRRPDLDGGMYLKYKKYKSKYLKLK